VPGLVDISTLIEFPAERYGRPCLAGTGMYLYRVIDLHRMGMSVDEMHSQFPDVPHGHFYAALAFYYANREECERAMDERDSEANRLNAEHIAAQKIRAR